ncbi:hypothetical protein EC912_108154 [Luteibacter rhizovicinus]|uniref:DUF2333 family protein n=1 Tax=Luteibacter rhizovicinus TaxID=242606 RepID=A0A4V2W3I9_9GAMM|nr:DUF2333 family protein [Luteibacter rhizovicinus]TCV92159.1 hypothetical protein EC912_108154 [Luteibacter rhizovicinus]
MEASTRNPAAPRRRRPLATAIVATIFVLAILTLGFMWWWDTEPPQFDPVAVTTEHMKSIDRPVSTGAVTTYTLIRSVDTLLHKRGGYISNDKLPPGVFLDNMPNWEFGSLTASRDLVRALRNDFSRSQTQSIEDKDLGEADPLLSSPNDRWLLPSSESQYGKAIDRLEGYLSRLGDAEGAGAHFYARADNLADYLQIVSTRLGSLSQRLSASVGQLQIDAAPSVDASGKPVPAGGQIVRTPWSKIDDNFYEARGYTWALLEQLKAIRQDFGPILRSKNADAGLQQVIRELEESQKALGSPVVLNGSPFGFFANHSLVMANYISRANAAIIDLRALLARG